MYYQPKPGKSTFTLVIGSDERGIYGDVVGIVSVVCPSLSG